MNCIPSLLECVISIVAVYGNRIIIREFNSGHVTCDFYLQVHTWTLSLVGQGERLHQSEVVLSS